MDLPSTIQLAETEFCTDHCHSAVLGDLDTMNKELLALEEKFLRLGVRTHLLEVELATQFSPDHLDDQETAYSTWQDCKLLVDEESQRVESLCSIEMNTEDCDTGKEIFSDNEREKNLACNSVENQGNVAVKDKIIEDSPESHYEQRKEEMEPVVACTSMSGQNCVLMSE